MEIKFDPADLRPIVREVERETLRELGRGEPHNGQPKKPDSEKPMLLKSRKTAAMMQICERTLSTLVDKGEIPIVRIGRSLRFDPKDIQRWIDNNKNANLKKNT